jgi:hypothetical protein
MSPKPIEASRATRMQVVLARASLELLPRSRLKEVFGKLSNTALCTFLSVFAFADKVVHPVVLPQTPGEVPAGHRVRTTEQPEAQDASC